MNFEITAIAKVELSYDEEAKTSKLQNTKLLLEVSKELNPAAYLDKRGLPTKEGSEALTSAFIMGLVGNIHMAHEKGFRDSAEHLRYIIGKLEAGFIAVPTLSISTWKEEI